MQIAVLVEAVAGNGYRANAGDPFGLTAFGATREETLRNLEELIEDRLASGAELMIRGPPGWPGRQAIES